MVLIRSSALAILDSVFYICFPLCPLRDLCGKTILRLKNILKPFWRTVFLSIDTNPAKTRKYFYNLSYNQNAPLVLIRSSALAILDSVFYIYFPLCPLHHLRDLCGKRATDQKHLWYWFEVQDWQFSIRYSIYISLCALCATSATFAVKQFYGWENTFKPFWRTVFLAIDTNPAKTRKYFDDLSYNQNAPLALIRSSGLGSFRFGVLHLFLLCALCLNFATFAINNFTVEKIRLNRFGEPFFF